MSFPVSFPAQQPLATVTHRTCSKHSVYRGDNQSYTTASPSIWVLELHNGADSRLSEHFIKNAILPALDAVERDWRQTWRVASAKKDQKSAKGALIIVGNRSQEKFFSNGVYFP